MARNWINRTHNIYNSLKNSESLQFKSQIALPEVDENNYHHIYDNQGYNDDYSWNDEECPDADYALSSPSSLSEAGADDEVESQENVGGIHGNGIQANGIHSNGIHQKTTKTTTVQLEPGSEKPTRTNSKLKQTKKAHWNVFGETSNDRTTHSERQRWRTINVIVKICLCTVFFFLVLSSATLSKLTIIYMIFFINPGKGFGFHHVDRHDRNRTFEYELKRNVRNHVVDVKWVWALILILCSQYFFTVLFSLWKIIFKKTPGIKCASLLMALVTETLHSIGLTSFIFFVLPSFDPLTGCLLTWNVATVPGILKIFLPDTSPARPEVKDVHPSTVKSVCRRILDFIMVSLHVGTIAAWAYKSYYGRDIYVTIMLPVSLTFISLSWWENFVSVPKRAPSGGDMAAEEEMGCWKSVKQSAGKLGAKSILITSVWKILMTIGVPALFFGYGSIDCVKTFFFLESGSDRCSLFGNIRLLDSRPPIEKILPSPVEDCHSMLPFIIACVNIVSSVVCYKTGKSACKILCQIACFTLPILFSGPVTVVILICTYTFPGEVERFLGCFSPWVHIGGVDIGEFLLHFTFEWWLPVGFVGFVSMVYIAGHTFSPRNERLARTERLFVNPLFCGILLEQSLLLNRRRDEDDGGKRELGGVWTKGDVDTEDSTDESSVKRDTIPMIYICATMWHETEQEMINMLKSVFRLDSDQSARKLAQSFFSLTDPDYYEFEAHIFFDDAFQAHDDNCVQFHVNDFVKQLVRVIQRAASDIHGPRMEIRNPVRIATPYGGRLVWNMPGGNKIIAHVKDKAKIRHRKRWSQVMYMYFFLGYQLLSKKMPLKRKMTRAENTYLLALDGDVDFQPMAVQILVDRMKTNPNLGAACGRIHPIGSGPMVWYQKFEYAVSHWLAKATEHMLGCVLCSPGCFSLFRGSALMDDNVMKKYTTPPSEPRHYVQYDQGEDRWLCTLLLQQGYRVEYAAASDSYTFAPEGFYEFYNQRRRWTPSTMANILDLLTTWTATTKKNEDISWLYMFYQATLLVSSIITPGTIFLLVLGALRTAYDDIPLYGALLLNLIPVVIFVLLCLKAPSDYQLAFAGILSIFYSLLMMLVLVGLIKQVGEYGFCAVTTIFLITVTSIFVVAAFLHPQEFTCILHGFLYFLTLPSMSMLLVIYSLANLHNVSWGTREVKQAAPPPKQQESTAAGNKGNMIQQFVGRVVDTHNLESNFGFKCGNMFTCACCPTEDSSKSRMEEVILARLDELDQKITVMASMDGSIRDVSDIPTDSSTPPTKEALPAGHGLNDGTEEKENPFYEQNSKDEDAGAKDNLPHWIKDEDLGDGEIHEVDDEEKSFWDELISLYLFPLIENKEHKKKIQTELIELRNKVCLAFLLLNALFIILIYTLETISEDSENLSFKLPCDSPTFKGEKVEPISMTFTFVFGIMLTLQFIAMLFHRFSTFLHIASITNLHLTSKVKGQQAQQPGPVTVEETIDLVREMQTVPHDDAMSVLTMDAASSISSPTGKDLWSKLASRRRNQAAPKTLSKAFMKNYGKLVSHLEEDEVNETTEEDRAQQLQRKFKRFERKTLATIVKMTQASPDVKQQIISRGKKRWEMLRQKVHESGKQGVSDIVKRVIERQREQNMNGAVVAEQADDGPKVPKLLQISRLLKLKEQERLEETEAPGEKGSPRSSHRVFSDRQSDQGSSQEVRVRSIHFENVSEHSGGQASNNVQEISPLALPPNDSSNPQTDFVVVLENDPQDSDQEEETQEMQVELEDEVGHQPRKVVTEPENVQVHRLPVPKNQRDDSPKVPRRLQFSKFESQPETKDQEEEQKSQSEIPSTPVRLRHKRQRQSGKSLLPPSMPPDHPDSSCSISSSS